jgi:hypothetical protein
VDECKPLPRAHVGFAAAASAAGAHHAIDLVEEQDGRCGAPRAVKCSL